MPICLAPALPIILSVFITIIVVIMITKKETYPTLPPSIAAYMNPANQMCIPRVSTQCRGLDYADRIGCVQENMLKCLNNSENSTSISRQCLSDVCEGQGKCKNPQECYKCRKLALFNGICAKPDLN